jgi:hypothetical protein
MWSRIADKKEEEEVVFENKTEDDIEVVEVPTTFEIIFKKEIGRFIRDNYDMLNYIYNKCFKGYAHIDKKDFYILAYYNSRK